MSSRRGEGGQSAKRRKEFSNASFSCNGATVVESEGVISVRFQRFLKDKQPNAAKHAEYGVQGT
jgi:hypothetical protein